MRSLQFVILLLAAGLNGTTASINRQAVVQQFNPFRNASSLTTPLQVGNGNFAFGADVSGLQTFLPYNVLSTWCWHNSSLPTTPNQTEPSDFTGLDWWTHGRLVNYDQPNPAENDISNWLIENPQRVNLGRVGLYFGGANVTEDDVTNKQQSLDMYTGTISSEFEWDGQTVQVTTFADPGSTTIGIEIESQLLSDGTLGLFFDYPYMTGVNKFEAPFVGVWNATANHTTELVLQGAQQARIQHDEDATTYFTSIHWDGEATISGPISGTHQYVLKPQGSARLSLTVSYYDTPNGTVAAFYNPDGEGTHVNANVAEIRAASNQYWCDYWENGAFIDLTGSNNASATELQRRIIQTQYLALVNEAGFDPAQESGLTNNGWYGKFHAEEFLWHSGHWARWSRWNLLARAIPGVYNRFLPTSIERAALQGYKGARWGKESDPTGRSAPGEINSLLIWQQPHLMQFAEYEYRSFPTNATLQKWDTLLTETADFMASFAFWNESTKVFDLGPPMYPMSENTDPNLTFNPTFELAYWRFGLDVAANWKGRQGKVVPSDWLNVANNLAPLPVEDETYVIYEGIPTMWDNTTFDEDHPSMLGAFGWLPPQPSQFNLTIMQNTAAKVYETWNFTYSYGWDFPYLAMNAARLGYTEKAIDFLLDPTFQFDDAGYQVGGSRVPTPYFPGSLALLWAVAMLAGGWDGSQGLHFPEGWVVQAEGFTPAL